MCEIEMPLGHSASQAPVLVQPPNPEFVHFGYHCFGAARCFYASLREFGESRYACSHEEHGGAVLTCSHAGTATYTCRGVHALVGVGLGDGYGVGVGHAAGVDRYETACLKYLLESATVYGEVFYYGKAAERHGSMVMVSPS